MGATARAPERGSPLKAPVSCLTLTISVHTLTRSRPGSSALMAQTEGATQMRTPVLRAAMAVLAFALAVPVASAAASVPRPDFVLPDVQSLIGLVEG